MSKPDRNDYFTSSLGLRITKKDGTVFQVPIPASVEKKPPRQPR